jgi:hypothetical protein
VVGIELALGGAPRSLRIAVSIVGAVLIAVAIAWWGLIRHGPGAGRAIRSGSGWRDRLLEPDTAGLAFSVAGGAVMCGVLALDASDSRAARLWSAIFGLLAVVQLVRLLVHLRR